MISLKLEMEPSVVTDQTQKALERYCPQAVVANILEPRWSSMVFLTNGLETRLSLSDEEMGKRYENRRKRL